MKTRNKKPIPYYVSLLVGALLTCVLANFLTLFYQFGGFTTWKSLPSLPAGVKHIVNADGDNIWVETNNDNIFTANLSCNVNENCKKWIKVNNSEVINPFLCSQTKSGADCRNVSAFFPRDPLFSTVNECVMSHGCTEPEYGYDTYFALMEDGTVKYWQHGNGLLGIYFFFIISTIVLPIITTIIIAIVYQDKYSIDKSTAG